MHLTHSQTMNTFEFASSVGYIYMKIRSRPIQEHSRTRMRKVTKSHLELLSKSISLRELFGGQSPRKNQIHVTCRARFIWIRSCSPHLSFCYSRSQWANFLSIYCSFSNSEWLWILFLFSILLSFTLLNLVFSNAPTLDLTVITLREIPRLSWRILLPSLLIIDQGRCQSPLQ